MLAIPLTSMLIIILVVGLAALAEVRYKNPELDGKKIQIEN